MENKGNLNLFEQMQEPLCFSKRETCVLMGSFGKYMVFGIQLYEIWKLAFNVESYIFFMPSEPAAYFVPRLSPDLVIFQNYPFCSFFFFPYPPSASHSLPSETGWHFAGVITGRHYSLLSSLCFFTLYTNLHHSPPTLYLSPIFKAHLESRCFWVLRQNHSGVCISSRISWFCFFRFFQLWPFLGFGFGCSCVFVGGNVTYTDDGGCHFWSSFDQPTKP